MRSRLFVVIAFVLYAVPAGALPILSFNPSSATVTPGETFSVDVVISGAEDLFAFQFDIGFVPGTLAAVTVGEGTFLASGGPTFFVDGSINNATGLIANTANTLLGPLNGVNGDGVLAVLTFRAAAGGISPITLFNATLLDSTLSITPFTVQNGAVTVPDDASSFTLLVVGLLSVFWGSHIASRKKAPHTA